MHKALVLAVAMQVTLAAPAVLFMTGCQPGEEPVVEEAPAETAVMSDEDMILKIGTDLAAAWNNGDAKGIAGFFTPDGDAVGIDGVMSSGREEIEKSYSETIEGIFKGATFSIMGSSIRFLQTDVALANGSWEVTGVKDAEGQDMPDVKGLYTNINVKAGDQWLIACSRPMVPVTMPGTN